MARGSHRRALRGLQNRKGRSPSWWTTSIKLMSPLGRLLRRYREQARLTQEELADRAGVSARTIAPSNAECALGRTQIRPPGSVSLSA
jgi:hypothetical protein